MLVLPVAFHRLVVKLFLALLVQLSRALRRDFLVLDEVLARKAQVAGMEAGVHAYRVARTGLDAKAAIDAAQRIDLVAHGDFFPRFVGILARLDVDALGRAGGGAEKAGGAAHAAVTIQYPEERIAYPDTFRGRH